MKHGRERLGIEFQPMRWLFHARGQEAKEWRRGGVVTARDRAPEGHLRQ